MTAFGRKRSFAKFHGYACCVRVATHGSRRKSAQNADAVDTSARNRVIAIALKRLGADEVAARLSIGRTAVRLYANGDMRVPNSIWALVLQNDSGLIEDTDPLNSESGGLRARLAISDSPRT